jgi:hypothetical protein
VGTEATGDHYDVGVRNPFECVVGDQLNRRIVGEVEPRIDGYEPDVGAGYTT